MSDFSSLFCLALILLGLFQCQLDAAQTPEQFQNNRLQMQLMRGFRINNPVLGDEEGLLPQMDAASDAEILAREPMDENTEFSMVRTKPERSGLMRSMIMKNGRERKMLLNSRSDPYRSFNPSALRNLVKT